MVLVFATLQEPADGTPSVHHIIRSSLSCAAVWLGTLGTMNERLPIDHDRL
jgi:hypothetical protein